MTTLPIIEINCKALATGRARLRRLYEAKQKAINAVNAQHDAEIRNVQSECALARHAVEMLLEDGRELFKSPKSREFYGITVGFEKGRDSVTMPEETILVSRIQTMLPAAQGRTLLETKTTIIKAAFKKLAKDVLQKLGCSVVSGADKPIVRADDDDIETLVQKSMGDGSPAAAEAK